MLFSVPQQDRTTLFHLNFLGLAPFVVMVLVWWVLTPSALRFATRLQHAHPLSAEVSKKSMRHAGTIALLSLLFLPLSNMSFFSFPLTFTLRMHLILSVGWTVMTRLMKFRKTQNKRLPLGCFWTNYMSKILLGLLPFEPHRVADILPRMKIVSRASRPELTVGVLRILCNGLCTAYRFHTEEHDDTCRVGCPNEPDSLSDCNECLRLHDRFTSCWRHATVFPRRNHDLITHLYLQAFIMGLR